MSVCVNTKVILRCIVLVCMCVCVFFSSFSMQTSVLYSLYKLYFTFNNMGLMSFKITQIELFSTGVFFCNNIL